LPCVNALRLGSIPGCSYCTAESCCRNPNSPCINLTILGCSRLDIASTMLTVISLQPRLCLASHQARLGHTRPPPMLRSLGATSPLYADHAQEKHKTLSTLPWLALREFLSALGRHSLGMDPLSHPFLSSIQLWCRTGLA